MTGRGRGCVVGAAALLTVVGALAAFFLPRLLREGQTLYRPISQMKRSEAELKQMAKEHPWKAPLKEGLTPQQLDRFLGVRRQLSGLYKELDPSFDDLPRGEEAAFETVRQTMQGVGELVSRQMAIFVAAEMNPAEYRYVERIAYRRWRRALRDAGTFPIALTRAADEVEQAAQGEPRGEVARRLRETAAEMRKRVPPAPSDVSTEMHELLLSRIQDIERYSLDDYREIPVPEPR